MSLTPLIVGNWKLNLSLVQALQQIEILIREMPVAGAEIAIAPVVTQLSAACLKVQGASLKIAAQNVFYAAKGAYTGEWAVAHLQELGVSMAIIGHSERRQYFAEDSKSVALKAKACIDGNLTPIVCIGETLAQRRANETQNVLLEQLEPVLEQIPENRRNQIVVAYEPVWAIGTGQHAEPEQVARVHEFLRAQVGPSTRLIYGGSVKADNAAELAAVKDVNGFLVGGASLDANSFLAIAKVFSSL
ncbi:MAG: triose-phosphate isomerase [Myxococcota bacterium]